MAKQIENILVDYESPFDAEYETECPICEGPDSIGIYLGTLGQLKWYRCQACGIEYNIIN